MNLRHGLPSKPLLRDGPGSLASFGSAACGTAAELLG